MLRKLIKNKKAQNTAEYAILISLVVAGIIAMQTYAQRALQARVRDASLYLVDQTAEAPDGTVALGETEQYEPYYLESDYKVTRDDVEVEALTNTRSYLGTDTNTTRDAQGYQKSTYSEDGDTPQGI